MLNIELRYTYFYCLESGAKLVILDGVLLGLVCVGSSGCSFPSSPLHPPSFLHRTVSLTLARKSVSTLVLYLEYPIQYASNISLENGIRDFGSIPRD